MSATLRFAANVGWLFTELPLEQRFEAAAQAGFKAVEFANPYPDSIDQVRRWLTGAGLELLLINSPMGEPGTPTRWGSACLPDQDTQFRRGVLQALEYATGLGAPFVHVPGGAVPEGSSLAEGLAHYETNIAWATEQAAACGVRILLEAINRQTAPRFVVDGLPTTAEVIQSVGGDHVGLLFDAFHAQLTEPDLVDSYRAHEHLTHYVQVADSPGRHEPGTGSMDFAGLWAALRANDYQGWIGCEYHPQGATMDGLGWLQAAAS